MKFGERLEQASVPGWSLHNVDYNSLKHQIKAHTTKDQATTATAIAIPGQQNYALKRFEDAFYLELCSQHNRVGLFVTSKADEISRRLRHLTGLVHQLMLRCADARGLSTKRQRRFVKYQTQIEECGQDIKALSRFVNAQVTAFRKILKKYKKWTGSTSLTSRFKENVLDNPKSFTNLNFTPLQLQYQELRTTLEAASPVDVCLPEPSLPTESRNHSGRSLHPRPCDSRRSSHSIATLTPPTYWNEYEHGSEAGDQDDAYVIYIDPNASDEFPGLAYVKSMFGAPVDHVRHWLQSQKPKDVPATSPSETQSLLGSRHSRTAALSTDYFSIRGRHDLEAGTEDEYLSSDEGESHHARNLGFFPSYSYSTSSAADLKIARYQDKLITRSIIVAFLVAFVLLGISSLLVTTGRRHLRLEVDAGATLGSVASLFCACMGLGAMFYRHSPAGYLYSIVVWGAFVAVCALNGILLMVVAGSSGL
ncbi:hypothetical protein ONZ43_g2877 [Nemania bipapillata]|uniref:Uncharacterized protein n=1 Tax=Nemania bipapillata TaxID=110536 RepID=A0ACC2IYV9_9PEZI|nr:hypothetical protein ONZ43_g2877 [Nemania bipapillata]